jgi:hypothetical protein
MKMTVVWDVAPCLIQIRRFRGAYYLNNQGNAMMIEAVSMSEMSISARLHGAISQMTVIFILATVRT